MSPNTTNHETNELGQPIGFPVEDWEARAQPARTGMAGRFCRVEPLDPDRHAAELHAANSEDREGRMWTYLPFGPYPDLAEWVEVSDDGLAYTFGLVPGVLFHEGSPVTAEEVTFTIRRSSRATSPLRRRWRPSAGSDWRAPPPANRAPS